MFLIINKSRCLKQSYSTFAFTSMQDTALFVHLTISINMHDLLFFILHNVDKTDTNPYLAHRTTREFDTKKIHEYVNKGLTKGFSFTFFAKFYAFICAILCYMCYNYIR